MGCSMIEKDVESRVAQDYFQSAPARRVSFLNGADVFFESIKHEC